MANNFLKTAFLLAALAVGLGAFGAHALRELIDERSLQTYQTAVQYHFIHVIALIITSILLKEGSSKWYVKAGYLFLVGIILFSGSLYTLTFFKAASVTNMNWLGAITPLGGLCFIAGWLSLFAAVTFSAKN
jgi:uncharacterized membrane protein YgdD (TMEM256/DUF423 family)